MIDKILMYSTLGLAVLALVFTFVVLIDLVAFDEALANKVRSKFSRGGK